MTGGTLKSSSQVRVTATDSATGAKAFRTTSSQQVVSFGTGSGRGTLPVSRSRSLAAGASETLDLYAGTALLDPFNGPTPYRVIRYIEIAITSGGDASGLRIGGAAAQCWVGFFAAATDKFLIFPTGPSFRGGSDAGVPVGPTTNNLKIENLAAAEVVYDVVIDGHNEASGYAVGVLGLTYP